MKITPRNSLVTVRLLKPRKDTMIGKIHIPAAQGNQFQMAEVVEVGRGTPDFRIHVGTDDLKPGQTVLVKTGVQMDLGHSMTNYIQLTDEDGFDLAVLNQQDIMAIIEDTPDDAGEVIGVDDAEALHIKGENNGTD